MAAGGWSSVDEESQPGRLVTSLDRVRDDPFFAEAKAALLDLLAPEPGQRVVDVGCGTGDDAFTLAGRGCLTLGVELSRTMLTEARRRHPDLWLVAGEAGRLPLPASSVDALRADRVLQHLQHADATLVEWRRVLRPGGRLLTWDPDLTTARIDGVDDAAAAAVVAWRAATRPGRATVATLDDSLRSAGFGEVRIDERMLDLTDLERADGIMGLADWGLLAGDAGGLPAALAQEWSNSVHVAWRAGRLRYRCRYVMAFATG